MKTLLVGNFGAQNVGDELILAAALKDYPNAVVMTANAKASQKFCNVEFKAVPFPPAGIKSLCRYLFYSAYRQQVHGLKSFDKIVFAGGGLFALKIRACVLWWMVFLWLKKLNPQAEFRLEHQGVDKGLNDFAQKLTHWVFSRADFVSVRDKNSLQALQNLGLKNINLTQDRAWLRLQNVAKTQNSKIFAEGELPNLILINAIDYCEKEVFDLQNSGTSRPIKFVAFAPSDLKYVPVGEKGFLPKTEQQVIKLFLSANQAIGERLHFVIAAACFGHVSLLRAPYSEKVFYFAQDHQINRFRFNTLAADA